MKYEPEIERRLFLALAVRVRQKPRKCANRYVGAMREEIARNLAETQNDAVREVLEKEAQRLQLFCRACSGCKWASA